MATVGLGVEAKLTKETTFGLSYTESFDGDITSHGVSAKWRINLVKINQKVYFLENFSINEFSVLGTH